MIAGFWRRILAAVIDGVLIGVVGFVLGLLLGDQFMRIGGWTLLVGAAVALSYYVPLNSRLGSGRTLGKRALRIRVVDKTGQPISIGRSLVRSCVLLLPLFLNNAPVGPLALERWFLILTAIAVFGIALVTAYLYIFNRRTRQSLHDLIAGSYVVKMGDEEAGALPHMWRGHYVVVGLIFLTTALAPALLMRFIGQTSIGDLLPAYEAILNQPEVAAAQVMQGIQYFSDAKSGKRMVANFVVTARMRYKVANADAEATKLAGIVLDKDPAAEQRDMINVVLVEGWSIGIASSFHSHPYSLSPLQWRVKGDDRHGR